MPEMGLRGARGLGDLTSLGREDGVVERTEGSPGLDVLARTPRHSSLNKRPAPPPVTAGILLR